MAPKADSETIKNNKSTIKMARQRIELREKIANEIDILQFTLGLNSDHKNTVRIFVENNLRSFTSDNNTKNAKFKELIDEFNNTPPLLNKEEEVMLKKLCIMECAHRYLESQKEPTHFYNLGWGSFENKPIVDYAIKEQKQVLASLLNVEEVFKANETLLQTRRSSGLTEILKQVTTLGLINVKRALWDGPNTTNSSRIYRGIVRDIKPTIDIIEKANAKEEDQKQTPK